jgi:hypothetical protein
MYHHQATTTEILQGILHKDDEGKQKHERTGSVNTQEKKRQTGSSIDSPAHNQILKQQKQLNGRNHHIPININTDCQWTPPLSKDTIWQTELKRKI